MANDITKIDFKRWRVEIIATLILAWPIILSNLSHMLINTTDVLLLARYSKDALAASAIGVGFIFTPLVIGIGLLSASSAIIAKEYGEKRHSVREIRRTVRQSMWVAVSFSVPVMILLWFMGDFIKHVGFDPKLAGNIGVFVRALMFQILPALLFVCLRNFVTAIGRPIWATIMSVSIIFVNAILNYGLIFGNFGLPALGILGAGIGSTITTIIEFTGMVIIINNHPKFRRYYLFGRFWRSDWERYKKIWAVGLPTALQMGFEVSIFAFAAFLMGYISTDSVAAHSVAIQIASMAFMFPMGIAQAATVRVGTAFGANNKADIGMAGWAAFIIAMSFMCITASIMWLFPRELIGFFIQKNNADNEAVILLAIGFLKIAAIFQIADGAQVVGAGMLRGLQDTKWPMIFAAIGYWGIGIGVGALLAFKFGLAGFGIWIGLALGLAIVGILMIIRWSMRDRLILRI